MLPVVCQSVVKYIFLFNHFYPKHCHLNVNMAANTLIIDGSYLEGGGQILRNAAALSCILKIPITVNNIRAGRSNPGLRPQHLSGLQLISNLCGGKLDGGHVGSTEVSFFPGSIKEGSFSADTKTAGSICLLLQAALPCLLFAKGETRLTLKGGTNAEMAPQIDYFTWVLQPLLEQQIGIKFSIDIKCRGYFPKGGGEVDVTCHPIKEIQPINLTEFGKLTKVEGRAFVAGVLPIKIAQDMARSANAVIKKQFPQIPLNIDAVKEPQNKAFGNGTGIIVMADTSTGCRLAGSALGKKGVSAQQVGENAGKELMKFLSSGGCVDEYLQDQCIIFMALGKGKSQVQCGPISLHTKTAIHIAKTMTQAKFTIQQITEDLNIIECEGIGWKNSHI